MLRVYSPADRVPVDEVRKLFLQLRKSRNITQGQLALLLECNRKTVERIEQKAVATVDEDLFNRAKALK